ncbi:Retrovirus-related Pol polyprotein, partial [Mucuna pruriens]
MSFGHYNAPSTFKRCMLSIFSDLLEDCMEVFMEDFTMYIDIFNACLGNLARVLKWCIETDLVLNFEKCHFMVTKGICARPPGIKLKDRENFIKSFNKTAWPLSKLMQKDVEFVFNKECIQAFEELKTRLTSMPILQAPN